MCFYISLAKMITPILRKHTLLKMTLCQVPLRLPRAIYRAPDNTGTRSSAVKKNSHQEELEN
jgi:hypothetical protein